MKNQIVRYEELIGEIKAASLLLFSLVYQVVNNEEPKDVSLLLFSPIYRVVDNDMEQRLLFIIII